MPTQTNAIKNVSLTKFIEIAKSILKSYRMVSAQWDMWHKTMVSQHSHAATSERAQDLKNYTQYRFEATVKHNDDA